MIVRFVPSSELNDDWTAQAHVGQADRVSSSTSEEPMVSVTPRPPATESCWKEGCDLPRAVDYWCEEHGTARRERIKREMAALKNDSNGVPRKRSGAHEISVSGDSYAWQWACICGKGSAASAKTQGLASAAAARHLRATEKVAA